MARIASARVDQLERLVFTGKMLDNRVPSTPFDDQGFTGWPQEIDVAGVRFELEETDVSQDRASVAWYVPVPPR